MGLKVIRDMCGWVVYVMDGWVDVGICPEGFHHGKPAMLL